MHRLRRPLGKSPKKSAEIAHKKKTGKPGETSPLCTMNKYKMYIKNQKIQNIYKFCIFSSDILQKVDVDQMKPTWAMYFLQSL